MILQINITGSKPLRGDLGNIPYDGYEYEMWLQVWKYTSRLSW